jgi:hypothetical protein
MGTPESGTAVGHTGADSKAGNNSSGASLIRLQLTLWQQYL